jgi:hypothetical protein
MEPFTPEEIKTLLAEINEQSPDKVLWEDDGVYKTIIALKAKNYVLYSPEAKKPLKIKGSALKGSTRPEAVKELIKNFVETMAYIEDREEMLVKLQGLYDKYVAEAMTVTEIKRWSARKTLSSTMIESKRTNETRVIDAIKGSDYREGDRFFVYRMPDESLRLAEHFDGVYDKSSLLKNLYNTVEIFDTVLPVKTLFLNYSLKKNFKILLDKYQENRVS